MAPEVNTELPIAMFDSGVGGLTVLHECLVSLPEEDYVYLGDDARFPYGARTTEELRGNVEQISGYLLERGAKLLVIACNSAASAGQDVAREIAAEAGTSHRMLIYHFGSRDGLLAEVVGRMEAEQRELLSSLVTDDQDIFAVSAAFWAHLTSPPLLAAQRLFFEVYVQALYGREWTETFRASVIRAWEGPLVELFRRAGVPASRADAYAAQIEHDSIAGFDASLLELVA